MRVIVQLRVPSPSPFVAAVTSAAAAGLSAAVPAFTHDVTFAAVPIPHVTGLMGGGFSPHQPAVFALGQALSTQVIRGTIPDGAAQLGALSALQSRPEVVAVHADPVIEVRGVCGGSPAVGTHLDVAGRLDTAALAARGLDGKGVPLVIVDTGINAAHLAAVGQTPRLDPARGWVPAGVGTAPGSHPLDHGTMCAFDAGIAAPNADLLDYAVLLSTVPGSTAMAGLLSDAIAAYAHLRAKLLATPVADRRMVVSNSWGMYDPMWDFPPGHPGNYSDNPQHPFNVVVASLEAAGADVLFAAGNCGRQCPSDRCAFGQAPSICGANSLPSVLTVAAVDTTDVLAGYSSQGPGRLSIQKPDLAGYAHFAGSKVYPDDVDSGTSAACPVVAGVVAAVRTRHSAHSLPPARLRALLQRTARDLGSVGFDHDHGWGVIDPAALLQKI